MLRLGIIGLGNMGTGHAQYILEGACPRVRITAVADRRPSRREWAQMALPGARVFAQGAELIASGACEAALICTPHYQHPELSIDAFRHGLHVLCEKPAGVYTLQVRDMLREADLHPELTFGLMYNQRTNCVFRKMKDMIAHGEIGVLKRVSWIITDWYRTQYYYDSGAWRATWSGEGGGVLLNQCPHQLDLLQWLCGMPARVRAFCHVGKWHDIEVEDDVTAYLEYPGGATGVFVTSTGDAPGTNRLEITGTRGTLLCRDNQRLTLRRLAADERDFCRTAANAFEKPPCVEEDVPTDGLNPQHSAVVNAFAGHILAGEPLVADGREGIRGLMLSNAMFLSSWMDMTVELPIDEELFLRYLNQRRATSRRKEDADVLLGTKGSFGSNNS